MGLLVEKPGLWTTVQDVGRKGWQRYGVSVSGPMDEVSHRLANLLVNNSSSSATLEMTMIGGTYRVMSDMVLAICGADMSPMIGEAAVPMWRPIVVKKDAVLRFGGAGAGRFAYIAAAGGFSVPELLGSRSASTRSAFPGLAGRALRAGDLLPVEVRGQSEDTAAAVGEPFRAVSWFLGEQWRSSLPGETEELVIRAIRGKEWAQFDQWTRTEIEQGRWTCVIRQQSDRLGYRLEPAAPAEVQDGHMLSEAVTMGTVQVPPDGCPIVLMADRQTTGGYPRLLQLAAIDLPVFAQARPGQRIRIQLVELQEAVAAFVERERTFQWLEERLCWIK